MWLRFKGIGRTASGGRLLSLAIVALMLLPAVVWSAETKPAQQSPDMMSSAGWLERI